MDDDTAKRSVGASDDGDAKGGAKEHFHDDPHLQHHNHDKGRLQKDAVQIF